MFLRLGTYKSFRYEVERCVGFNEKMENSPVDKKAARRRCPSTGGDWSMAMAVISNDVSESWDSHKSVWLEVV